MAASSSIDRKMRHDSAAAMVGTIGDGGGTGVLRTRGGGASHIMNRMVPRVLRRRGDAGRGTVVAAESSCFTAPAPATSRFARPLPCFFGEDVAFHAGKQNCASLYEQVKAHLPGAGERAS